MATWDARPRRWWLSTTTVRGRRSRGWHAPRGLSPAGWLTMLLFVTATAGCGTLSTRPTPVAGSPPAASDALARRLDVAVVEAMRRLGVPGAIVGISVPGVIDYSRALGVADDVTGTPMTLDDRFRIGGVTKTFTGTALLRLVEQGKVSLSDPIGEYVDGVPGGDEITLRMLGDMHSGLFSYEQDPQFVARMLAELARGPQAGDVTPQDLLDVTARHPLNFPPGARFEYVDINAILLGMVVSKVSGQPLAEYFQQHVFDPLRLGRTSFPSSGQLPEPYAHGYTSGPDGATVDASLWNPAWAGAAGAIVSTYADLKTWALALGKGTLLSPEIQRERLEQVQQTGPAAAYRFAVFGNNGWWGHNGSIPGYTTVVMSIPERSATLVVLANTDIPAGHAAGRLAEVVTSIAVPDHVYTQVDAIPPDGRAPSPTPGR